LYLFKDSISVIDNQEIKDLVAKDYGKFVNMDDQILKNYAPLDGFICIKSDHKKGS
jgi:hypothetical protein